MDSCTTSGLGSCTPSAHPLSSQRLPGLLPHSLTAPPFPGHSHGGQAGPQIWAGCKARVISYLLSLFLKINCQGSDPKEKSKYKCIHNRSAPAAKHRESLGHVTLQTKAPREGTHTTVPRQGSGVGVGHAAGTAALGPQQPRHRETGQQDALFSTLGVCGRKSEDMSTQLPSLVPVPVHLLKAPRGRTQL